MKYIAGEGRNQITFLPDCIEDYVGEDNPVRVIDAFVDKIDMLELGFKRAELNDTGRPSYDPRDLLKLYIYGYFNKIRSSRKLMQECTRNLEVMYLIGKLVPDFRTISDFRKDNSKAISMVFREFAKLCMKMKLYQRELIAIDGTKIRAQNNKDNCYNQEVLDKKIANIEKHIKEYFIVLDESDKTERGIDEANSEEIKEAIKVLSERKEKFSEYKSILKESGEKQLLTTDPDARRMQSKNGFHCSYNIQTAVDGGSHLIAEYEVTNKTDVGHLKSLSDKAKKLLDVKTIEVLADKGYDSINDIKDCLLNGTVANASIREKKDERVFTFEYIENEIDETTRKSTTPEDIQKCLHAGVLPKCYEGKSLSIEFQGEDNGTVLACFTLNDDGTVTCPMGNILSQIRTRGKKVEFASRAACRFCTNKCTVGKYKTVSFGPKAKYVPVVMNNCGKHKISVMPSNIKLPNYFKKNSNKQVLIRMKHTEEMTTKRMGLSEHPFGTVKWYNGAHYVLCRGKEKVDAEIGLSFLAYNLRRAINMVGVKRIIEEI